MSRLLHIVFLIVATLGFCLTAQQLHSINDLAAARRGLLARQIQQRQDATGFVKAGRPTSVQDAPPAAQAVETLPSSDESTASSTAASISYRDTGELSDDSQPRPTKVKTPAAETVLPTNTKVPVAASGGHAVATSLSDPGFLALAASLGFMTLGMALV